MGKYLTLGEVEKILLIKNSHTVPSYIKKGIIPKIAINKNSNAIDANFLAKKLGVENFEEPFIDQAEARVILGISDKVDIVSFCKRKGINMYRISSIRGVRYLFRESDLAKHTSFQLEFFPFELEEKEKRTFRKLSNNFLSQMISLFESSRTVEIFISYLSGENLEDIGKKYGVGGERVRQILERNLEKLTERFEKMHGWTEAFRGTKYVTMDPKSFVQTVKNLEFENSYLHDKVKEMTIEFGEETQIPLEILEIKISNLDISVRAKNCLHDADVFTLKDLQKYKVSHLRKIRNLGTRSIDEILGVIAEYGLILEK